VGRGPLGAALGLETAALAAALAFLAYLKRHGLCTGESFRIGAQCMELVLGRRR
jgi:hypothetical protein